VGEFGDVGSERGVDVSRSMGSISTGVDPRSDDISVAAVLQTSEQFLQGIGLDVGSSADRPAWRALGARSERRASATEEEPLVPT